jgi:hypothetical protein
VIKKTVGLVAAIGLLLSACGSSSSDPGGGGLGEAIGVEGNWTIDIVNPDGSPDASYRFQNAFIGAESLSEILSMTKWARSWKLNIAGTVPLCDSNPVCSMVTLEFDGSPGVATITRDSTTNEVVIAGSFTPDNPGDVSGVSGTVEICGLDVPPESFCGTFKSFSNHIFDVPDRIPVAAGQLVQVEVRYSFG